MVGEMANANEENNGNSTKRVYDEITGFPLMVNLYVIKYIYYHIEKARCFIDEDNPGRKIKANPIYGKPGFPISRQRFDRINKGCNFTFARSDAIKLVETYGIDSIYFRKEEPVPFEIKGITMDDWKCFYNHRYKGDYELPYFVKNSKKAVENKAAKIETTLKGLVSDWERTLERDDPLFAICYYFHYGERFDKPNIMKNFKNILSILDFKEWDKEDIEELKKVQTLLENHYQYVNSLVTLEKLRKKEK